MKMKIESVRSFPTRVFTFGSREAFLQTMSIYPHFEDDPQKEDESAIFKISVVVFVRGVIWHQAEGYNYRLCLSL